MRSFVSSAKLPLKAETVIIGEKYRDVLEKPLELRGILPVYVPDNPWVDKRLSGHCDLSVFHPGGEGLLLAPWLRGSSFSKGLEALGAKLSFPDISQGSRYPEDAAMNACAMGKTLIFNRQVTSEQIIKLFTNMPGSVMIDSRQGYAGCSVCVVDEKAIITGDRGIARKAAQAGLDVLLISPGHVVLPGFEYGFIGGAAFKIASRRLAFTGRLEAHPDCEKIMAFLEKRGVEADFLSDREIFDIGGAVAITEA